MKMDKHLEAAVNSSVAAEAAESGKKRAPTVESRAGASVARDKNMIEVDDMVSPNAVEKRPCSHRRYQEIPGMAWCQPNCRGKEKKNEYLFLLVLIR